MNVYCLPIMMTKKSTLICFEHFVIPEFLLHLCASCIYFVTSIPYPWRIRDMDGKNIMLFVQRFYINNDNNNKIQIELKFIKLFGVCVCMYNLCLQCIWFFFHFVPIKDFHVFFCVIEKLNN